MLDNIKQELKIWDSKAQGIWEWDNRISIPNLISRLERDYYITKEVDIDLQVYDLSTTSFTCPDLFQFMTHYKLVENANLKYHNSEPNLNSNWLKT